MGGNGSGRQGRRPTVERTDSIKLNIHDMMRGFNGVHPIAKCFTWADEGELTAVVRPQEHTRHLSSVATASTTSAATLATKFRTSMSDVALPPRRPPIVVVLPPNRQACSFANQSARGERGLNLWGIGRGPNRAGSHAEKTLLEGVDRVKPILTVSVLYLA